MKISRRPHIFPAITSIGNKLTVLLAVIKLENRASNIIGDDTEICSRLKLKKFKQCKQNIQASRYLIKQIQPIHILTFRFS